MVDLGEIQYCLGIHINCVQQDRMIYLKQIKYIKSILKQFGITKSKLIQIVFTNNSKVSKNMGFQNDIELRVILFQNVIGSFMYVMVCI